MMIASKILVGLGGVLVGLGLFSLILVCSLAMNPIGENGILDTFGYISLGTMWGGIAFVGFGAVLRWLA